MQGLPFCKGQGRDKHIPRLQNHVKNQPQNQYKILILEASKSIFYIDFGGFKINIKIEENEYKNQSGYQ